MHDRKRYTKPNVLTMIAILCKQAWIQLYVSRESDCGVVLLIFNILAHALQLHRKDETKSRMNLSVNAASFIITTFNTISYALPYLHQDSVAISLKRYKRNTSQKSSGVLEQESGNDSMAWRGLCPPKAKVSIHRWPIPSTQEKQ